MAKKNFRMELGIKGILKMGVDTVAGYLLSLMGPITKARLSKVRFKDMVNTLGRMVGSIWEPGLIIIWKVMDYTLGQMGQSILVTIQRVNQMAMENIHGVADEFTRVSGRVGCGMEEAVLLTMRLEILSKEFGMKERELALKDD
jgi:hypothetical protein